ncbi:MAG: DUF1648 domain-containing protein [Clostridia bacterium]|nr:DUF1648 domain-containing protein [Clostridia bacterium]
MKFIKRKSLAVTCMVCLLPVFLGIALWDNLPDVMAIHFNFNNEPDNFASKTFTVFGLPLLMMALQIICCIINDVNSYKHGERKKFERVTKWIIPVMTIALPSIFTVIWLVLLVPYDVLSIAYGIKVTKTEQ